MAIFRSGVSLCSLTATHVHSSDAWQLGAVVGTASGDTRSAQHWDNIRS